MNKKLKFVKLSNRWFVDIPWNGDIEDLEMVCGADLLLESICDNNFYVTIELSTVEQENKDIILSKIKEDEFYNGCYYKVSSFEFKGEIWLCNVTKHVLNEFPDKIYLTKI